MINKAVKNRLHKLFLSLNVVIEHGFYFADTLVAFELKDCCRFLFVYHNDDTNIHYNSRL